MLNQKYIEAYKKFRDEEIYLMDKYRGAEYSLKRVNKFYDLVDYIEEHPEEFILFDKSGVTFYEYEYIESVISIKNHFAILAKLNEIPECIWYVPRVRIEGHKYDQVIHKKVAVTIRQLFDNSPIDDFINFRKYQLWQKHSRLVLWINSEKGKETIQNNCAKIGIDKKLYKVKTLKLFDDSFIYIQRKYLSDWFWIHEEIVKVYQEIIKIKT